MNNLYKLLLPAILLPFFTSAQTNYKPGYVVTISGDTLNGLINLKEWENNPRTISFKTSVSEKQSRTLGPKDITFFEATGFESYQRYIGPLNSDQTNISSLSEGRDTSVIVDSVFLKTVQKGINVTLYVYADNNKKHFFISENVIGKPVELIYRAYTYDGKLVTENGYMRQLFEIGLKYDNDTEALKLQIEKADYNQADLEGLSLKINNGIPGDVEKVNSKNKSTTFFTGIGLNINNITLDDVFGEKTSRTSLFPRISFGINVLSNPNVGRLLFRAEAAFTVNKLKTVESYNGGTTTYGFNQYNFSLIPQILYNLYNTDPLKFYLGAGASINISRYSGNNNVYKYNNITNESKEVLYLMKAWTSFPLKAGVVIHKRFDVTLTYVPTAAFTNVSAYDVTISTIHVGLNYAF